MNISQRPRHNLFHPQRIILPPLETVRYVPDVAEQEPVSDLDAALDAFVDGTFDQSVPVIRVQPKARRVSRPSVVRVPAARKAPVLPDRISLPMFSKRREPAGQREVVPVQAAEVVQELPPGTAWASPQAVLSMATTGKAMVIVNSQGLDDHLTFKLSGASPGSPLMISARHWDHGPLTPIGVVTAAGFRHLATGGIAETDQCVRRFATWYGSLLQGFHAPGTHTAHSGSCCCCGRKLTDPVSVATGVGPECSGRVGQKRKRSKPTCEPTT